MTRQLWLTTLILFLVVAGCSGGREANTFSGATITGLISNIRTSRAPDQPPVVVTRELVDATPGAVLQARAENLDKVGFLSRVSVRDEGEAGQVSVWQSGDNAQLVFRNGVLVTTRGLGFSLLSSDVAGTVFALASQQEGAVLREMDILRGDNSRAKLTLRCLVSDFGLTTISVVDETVPVRRMREDCRWREGEITNDYWIDPETSVMIRSRQWAGPETGYFSILVLKS